METNPLAVPANNIICSLTDPENRSLGPPLDLPQDAGPKELHLLINTLLQNVSKRFESSYLEWEPYGLLWIELGNLGSQLLWGEVED